MLLYEPVRHLRRNAESQSLIVSSALLYVGCGVIVKLLLCIVCRVGLFDSVLFLCWIAHAVCADRRFAPDACCSLLLSLAVSSCVSRFLFFSRSSLFFRSTNRTQCAFRRFALDARCSSVLFLWTYRLMYVRLLVHVHAYSSVVHCLHSICVFSFLRVGKKKTFVAV